MAIDNRKLSSMVNDLEHMAKVLVPDQHAKAREEEMKHMDNFQKKKMEVTMTIKDLSDGVARLDELKRSDNPEMKVKIIEQMALNRKAIKRAGVLWNELKDILMADGKKKRISPKIYEDRKVLASVLHKEITELSQRNARVKSGPGEGPSVLQQRHNERTQARERRAQAARAAAKNRRRNRRNRGGADAADEDEDLQQSAPPTEQEQAFYDEVEQTKAADDEVLDDINKGLEQLKEMGLEINKSLNLQQHMLDEVENKMDENTAALKSANERLNEIFEQSGGMSRWCPMLICFIILLSLVGYMFNNF